MYPKPFRKKYKISFKYIKLSLKIFAKPYFHRFLCSFFWNFLGIITGLFYATLFSILLFYHSLKLSLELTLF